MQEAARVMAGHWNACAGNGRPLGMILGTGLGDVMDAWGKELEVYREVPFADLPGFPMATGPTHAGKFLLGAFHGPKGDVPLMIQCGRGHLYEGYSPAETCMGVRVMARMGAESIVVTNAAGGINPRYKAGTLMLIADHINVTGVSPLTGPNDPELGLRFPDMSAAYDPGYQKNAILAARKAGLRLEHGVYIGVHGPEFETPAEVRMYRAMGADAVGMSTVLEVIAAKHLGMRVLGVSCITNVSLPDCMAVITLEGIQDVGIESAGDLGRLLGAMMRGEGGEVLRSAERR